jgi:hypothetical protein
LIAKNLKSKKVGVELSDTKYHDPVKKQSRVHQCTKSVVSICK